MKPKSHLLHFLFCVAALAQQTPSAPQNLSVMTAEPTIAPAPDIIPLTITSGTNNPIGVSHQGLVGYWQAPTETNIWVPEWNFSIVNGTNWSRCGNEWSGIDGWHFTETGAIWDINGLPMAASNQWQIRIRNVGPVPPLPPPSTNPPASGGFAILPPRSERH